jgi:aerobic-type carbon monoxide dehydrogenase small subunit (CoxS/CutS family)
VLDEQLALGARLRVVNEIRDPDEVRQLRALRSEELAGGVELDDEEIRERMSGNLCRCGAYANIVAAIREVAR